MSIQIETVRTDTFSMDYFKFGQGEETLVILPGLSVQSVMGLADSIADAYRILAEKYTVYLFDRRKELPAVYTVQEMARDTVEAVRLLGLDRINLFGASQGGMISMVIAIEHPDLVRKLALGSTSSCVGNGHFEKVEQWIRMARTGDRTGLYLLFGEDVYPEAVFEQSRDLLVEAARTVTDEELARFIILAQGAQEFDVTKDLKRIDCPVLVLGSRDDQVVGGDAAVRIAENLRDQPGHELFMYDGYGHAVYDTAPDYKERLLNFFQA